MAIDLRHMGYTHTLAYGLSSFLARHHNSFQHRHLCHKCRNVSLLHHFKILIAGIILQPSHGCCRIKETDAILLAMADNIIQSECLALLIHKMLFVTIEHLPLYAPMVVDEVGIIEVHTPPFTLGRKAAQE